MSAFESPSFHDVDGVTTAALNPMACYYSVFDVEDMSRYICAFL